MSNLPRMEGLTQQDRVARILHSPTPQIKSINSSVLSFLYISPVTSIYDYWENHCFNYRDFYCKLMSLLFNMPGGLPSVGLHRVGHE